MTRTELQTQVADWITEHNNIMLAWPTSVGKSRGFISIQSRLGTPKTYLVVSERAHIENWEEEYRKYGREDLLANTVILCYASLQNYVHTKVDLIGLDEVHHSSCLRLNRLKTIKTTKVVAMSATLNPQISNALAFTFGPFKESVISLDFAIQQGWIQKPQIILIPLTLKNEERTETIIINKSPVQKEIICDFPYRFNYMKLPYTRLIIKCTEWEKYYFLNQRVTYFSNAFRMHSGNKSLDFAMKRAGLERKQYLSDLKTTYIKEFISTKDLENKRYICFCGSINQAEAISKNVIHSKIKHPEQVLNAFKEGKINELFAVNMLKEGVNIPNIHSCIITQLDSKERSFIQKAGRALRNPEDPIVYIFYFKDTQDEVYLDIALSNLDKKYIQWI